MGHSNTGICDTDATSRDKVPFLPVFDRGPDVAQCVADPAAARDRLSDPPSTRLVRLVNQSLGKMVYLILFLMGLGLAYVENLGSNLAVIFKVAGIMLTAITLCNLLALWWLDRRSPPTHEAGDGKMPSKLHLLWESTPALFRGAGGVPAKGCWWTCAPCPSTRRWA